MRGARKTRRQKHKQTAGMIAVHPNVIIDRIRKEYLPGNKRAKLLHFSGHPDRWTSLDPPLWISEDVNNYLNVDCGKDETKSKDCMSKDFAWVEGIRKALEVDPKLTNEQLISKFPLPGSPLPRSAPPPRPFTPPIRPQPAPAPAPQPRPQPAPAPAPQPRPQPAPQPRPQPAPAPAPQPRPQPRPQPAPAPAPAPAPQPRPQPPPARQPSQEDIPMDEAPPPPRPQPYPFNPYNTWQENQRAQPEYQRAQQAYQRAQWEASQRAQEESARWAREQAARQEAARQAQQQAYERAPYDEARRSRNQANPLGKMADEMRARQRAYQSQFPQRDNKPPSWFGGQKHLRSSTRGRRLLSLPTRRAPRFSSSKKRRYSRRRLA